MGKYLDYNGLSYLWDKIKLYLSSALSTKVDKISSTDNAAARFNGGQGAILNSGVIIDDNNNVTAAKFIKSSGTSSQFLKADGSVDSNTYLKTGDIAAWAKEANKPSYSWSEIISKPDTFTPSSHIHGNISNTGTLTDTAAASGTNDLIVLRNSSDNKVRTSTIKGTDVEDAVSKKHSHSNITLSKTAQAYDGTHTIVLPSSDPYTSARTPSSHTHGNISNTGTLGTASVAVVTDGDKKVTTADLTVSSATAETTTATTFVYSVTQSAQGKITVKTRPLPTYNNYSLPTAASNTLGGIKTGYTTSGNNRAVQVDSNGNAYVVQKDDNTNYYHTTGSWNGLTYTATANGGAGALALTLPTGTSATTVALGNHTHGNIQNGGTLQTNDVTIANGDKLVVTDSSDSSKVARTSVSFDGSTTTKALTPKGTWVTFLQTETDPTVPAWAKASSKPTYNLDEVSDGSTRKLSTLAPKASPALTGTPTAPTASTGTNTTLIATTAFVQLELGNVITDIEDNEKVIAASLNDLEERKLDAVDLPEWAANSTKPSYSWSEITGKPSTFTPSSHTHGNITNAGELGTASRLVVTDSNKKITVLDATVNSPTASGTGTAFITSVSLNSQGKISATKANLPEASTSVKGIVLLGTTSTTAALGNHTHTTTIATSTGTNQLTLSHGGKYSITAGGTSYIFTMPASGNTDRYVNSAAFADDSTNTSASPIKMTLTRAGSDTATVTANIPKVSSSSAGVAPKGAAVSSQSQSTKFLREDGTWAAPSYTTNTNTTYSFTGGTNGRFSVTPSGGNAQTVAVTKSFGDSIEYIVGTQTAATNLWIGVTQEASLSAGKMIAYKLPVAGNSSGATLNLTLSGGGTTGAIGIRRKGSSGVTTHYAAGEVIFMVYDGTYWQVNADFDSNDTGYYIRRYYTGIKAGPGKIYPYTLIMLLPDGRWESIVTSSSTGTSKSRNTHGFLLGKVLLMYANSTYTENQNVGTSYIWTAHSGIPDHRYSFNTANDATNGTIGYKPIYLVGSIGQDKLFYLDETWWTQTLPSTEDGKLYIYIGDAYDYYRFILSEVNSVYVYSNGGIRLYGGTSDNVSWSNVTSKPSLDGIPDGSTRKLSDYVKYNPGASEQTIKSSISSLSKGVVNLWRNSGDHYTFLGFSSGTTETYLGGIGFKSQSDSNLYRKDNSGNYYKILDENNWTGVIDGRYLKLSGGTMTGALTLNGAPTSNLHAATKKYVDDSINALPEPMLFKGSLGTGGTITSLPTAAAANEGFTYKVITAGTYANQAAKIGDTFISDGSNWVLIPSGDEPSGTVTSVGASGSGGITVSGSPVTTSGTIAIGLNLSTAINGLGEGSSNATRNDYIVAQYAGGGTTTTTYHRRKLSNIFAALNSSDITTALGYTPYNSTNPNGYTSNTGTVTSITLKATSPIAIDSTAAITTSGTRTFSHSNSGVTAGTYESVTVNATGHVTAGTNPTKYWANVQVGSSTNYNTEPELKSVKINGSTTNSASTANALLLYDTTNKCLNFIVT